MRTQQRQRPRHSTSCIAGNSRLFEGGESAAGGVTDGGVEPDRSPFRNLDTTRRIVQPASATMPSAGSFDDGVGEWWRHMATARHRGSVQHRVDRL